LKPANLLRIDPTVRKHETRSRSQFRALSGGEIQKLSGDLLAIFAEQLRFIGQWLASRSRNAG
jgi:hypothetical protein